MELRKPTQTTPAAFSLHKYCAYDAFLCVCRNMHDDRKPVFYVAVKCLPQNALSNIDKLLIAHPHYSVTAPVCIYG